MKDTTAARQLLAADWVGLRARLRIRTIDGTQQVGANRTTLCVSGEHMGDSDDGICADGFGEPDKDGGREQGLWLEWRLLSGWGGPCCVGRLELCGSRLDLRVSEDTEGRIWVR
jgi:hypothetical protein